MFALPSQDPAQAVAQTGSHTGSGSVSHWAWQSTEHDWAHDERHSPWFGASWHLALQAC
jgi:hypothetical protein